jgi:hypothetical protein
VTSLPGPSASPKTRQGVAKSETSAFTSQSEISPKGALSFLWCSFRGQTHRLSLLGIFSVLAKAEGEPRDLSEKRADQKNLTPNIESMKGCTKPYVPTTLLRFHLLENAQ